MADHETPIKPISPKTVSLVTASTVPEMSNEVSNLLVRRLRAAALLIGIGLVLFLGREFFIVTERHPFMKTHVALTAVIFLCWGIVGRGRFAKPAVVRGIEVVLFGTTAAFLAMKYDVKIALAARDAMALDQERTASFVPQALLSATISIHELTTGCFALAILYGLLIPNRPQRAALVVVPILLLPLAVPVAVHASGEDKKLPDLVDIDMWSGAAIVLVTGGVIAVYGAHILSSLRREVFEAKQLGQYRLIQRIGKGGMGEVWQAQHALLKREAAIKLIHTASPHSGSEDADTLLRRFETEAQATARLQSPHTVRVYDFGRTLEGVFYLVMELMEGQNLDALVRRVGVMPPERVAAVMMQVCESLEEAHAMGLVHRDIKPANLFSAKVGCRHDVIKVLDFGLVRHVARLAASNSRLTKIGSLGSPAFIAPEQAEDREDIDGRADIYALGCVGYFLLTGQFVFPRDNAVEMVLDHIRTAPVPPGKRIGREFPPEFESIIMSCLEKSPDDRPSGARELSRRLSMLRFEDPWSEERARTFWARHMKG